MTPAGIEPRSPRPDATDEERGETGRVTPKPRERSGNGVSWTIVNFWLDLFLLMTFVSLAGCSAILQFVFPAATDLSGWTLWNRDVVFWRNLQFGVLCVLAAGIVLHVMLHWSWVCGVVNRRLLRRTAIPQNGTDTLIGAGLIAVILHVLAAGVILAQWSLHRP